MAISVNPITHVIYVPKTDLTWDSGTLYNHNTDAFRLQLKAWEESVEGIVQLKTHNHNTSITVAGITYARAISILPPYSVEYENGEYTVVLIGSNNNIFDVANGILVQNYVQVIPTNAAGLITVISGSGMSEEEHNELMKITDIKQKANMIPGLY